jgi:hypothetical protein
VTEDGNGAVEVLRLTTPGADDDPTVARSRHFDPTDVFSPYYEEHMAEAVAPHPQRSEPPVELAERPIEAVLRGGIAASVAFALGLAVMSIPLPQGGHVDTSVQFALQSVFAALPFKELMSVTAVLAQVALAAGIVILWTARRNRRRARDFVLLSVTAAIVVYVISGLVDLVVQRALPIDQAGIFALATLLAFSLSRRAGVIVGAIALWTMLYRIGTGVNAPADAFGGAMFGTAAGVCAIRFRSHFEPSFARVRELFRLYPAPANAIAFIVLADFALGFPILKGLAQAIFRTSS